MEVLRGRVFKGFGAVLAWVAVMEGESCTAGLERSWGGAKNGELQLAHPWREAGRAGYFYLRKWVIGKGGTAFEAAPRLDGCVPALVGWDEQRGQERCPGVEASACWQHPSSLPQGCAPQRAFTFPWTE